MGTYPRIEARVSAQERQQNILNACIEELAEDMTTSFKQLSEYLGKIESRLDKVEEDTAEIKTQLETNSMNKPCFLHKSLHAYLTNPNRIY